MNTTNTFATTILDLLPDILYLLDEDGVIIDVNYAVRTLGFYPEEIIGKSITALVPPEHRHKITSFLHHRKKKLTEYQPGDTPQYQANTEIEFLAKNGTIRSFEIAYAIIPHTCTLLSVPDCSQLQTERHQGVCTVGIARDITTTRLMQKDLIQKQEELDQTNEMLKDLYNTPYLLVGALHQDGTIIHVNKTALQMIDARLEDMVGQKFWETPWWNHNNDSIKSIKEAFNSCNQGTAYRNKTTHIDKHGKTRYIDFMMSPIFDRTGKLAYIIPIGRDITEETLAQKIADAREKKLIETMNRVEVSNLVAALIHDANNALSPIKGYTFLLRIKMDEWKNQGLLLSMEDSLTQAISAIDNSADRLTSLFETVRKLSRGISFEASPVNYNICQNAEDFSGIAKLRMKTHQKYVNISIIKPQNPLYAYIDPQHYYNIVVNLINNAIDAISEKGVVKIEFGLTGTSPSIKIHDNGIGIPKKIHDLISRGYSTKTLEKGTGLGLPMCFYFSQINKAQLLFTSEEGKGTTFTLIMATSP